VDYSVQIEAVGGSISLNVAPTTSQKIKLTRLVSNYQPKSYSTSTGFQGDEIEKSFDRVSCNTQDMQYNIDEFKQNFSSEINEKIDANKKDLDEKIDNFKNDTNSQISDFETEVNNKLDLVNSAANKLNRLDEVLDECEEYSKNADIACTEAKDCASAAVEKVNELSEMYEVVSDLDGFKDGIMSDVDTKIATIKQNEMYIEDGNLYYTDENGEKQIFTTASTDDGTHTDSAGTTYGDTTIGDTYVTIDNSNLALQEAVVITDTHIDGGDGWRIYSDGYIEQWGRTLITYKNQTVSIHKEMADTNYFISANCVSFTRYVACYNLTTTTFDCYTADDASFNSGVICWKVTGYLAEGQY
jgi:gas vesicle protein